MDDVDHAAASHSAGDHTVEDDHPAGAITLPTRIRAEVKILAMVGMTAVLGGVLAVGSCRSSLSIGPDGLHF